jgi:hypothetical protein
MTPRNRILSLSILVLSVISLTFSSDLVAKKAITGSDLKANFKASSEDGVVKFSSNARALKFNSRFFKTEIKIKKCNRYSISHLIKELKIKREEAFPFQGESEKLRLMNFSGLGDEKIMVNAESEFGRYINSLASRVRALKHQERIKCRKK